MAIPAHSKKLPKWHFLTLAWNLKFFGPNAFIWSTMKVPFCDFIQNLSQAPSKCLSKWIKVDKWDYFKNPSQELKISFCLGFLWIPKKTGRQNWRGPIFLRFNLVKKQCGFDNGKKKQVGIQATFPSLKGFFFSTGLILSRLETPEPFQLQKWAFFPS